MLGASTPGLVARLSRGFTGLVALSLAAGLLAAGLPPAWLAARRWLGTFAYRIELGAAPFVGAGVAVLAVALLATGTQALRAARANPAEALRDE